jgi:hypothetical protein
MGETPFPRQVSSTFRGCCARGPGTKAVSRCLRSLVGQGDVRAISQAWGEGWGSVRGEGCSHTKDRGLGGEFGDRKEMLEKNLKPELHLGMHLRECKLASRRDLTPRCGIGPGAR